MISKANNILNNIYKENNRIINKLFKESFKEWDAPNLNNHIVKTQKNQIYHIYWFNLFFHLFCDFYIL